MIGKKTRLGKGSNNMEIYPALSSHSQKILLRSNGEHTLFLKQQNESAYRWIHSLLISAQSKLDLQDPDSAQPGFNCASV